MRLAAALLTTACAALAQFRSTVPLVVAPTTVTDAKGHYVDGLGERDLVLYDNNVPQQIHLDFEIYPISLVVAVESGEKSGAVLDKLGGSGILLAQLVSGDAGETAVLSYSDGVKLHQGFTTDADAIGSALRSLKIEGSQACALDAVMHALRMLSGRPAERRRIVLLIGEKRERHSSLKLPEVMAEVERQNALIYWLTYSPSWTEYTQRWKTVKSDDPKENGNPIPPEIPPGGLITGLQELYHLGQPDVADLFTRVTGARTIGFLRKRGLEDAIHAIGEEVHRQYILSYQPPPTEPGRFHTIRVEVKDRPELRAKTRQGYWAVER